MMTDKQLAILIEMILQRIEQAVEESDRTVADLLAEHGILAEKVSRHSHPTCFDLFCTNPEHMVSERDEWHMLDPIREVLSAIRTGSGCVLGGREARAD
jgi:hypothetical protein